MNIVTILCISFDELSSENKRTRWVTFKIWHRWINLQPLFMLTVNVQHEFNLGNVHLLPEGDGSKSGGLQKLLKVGRGVYEKIWTSSGGFTKIILIE